MKTLGYEDTKERQTLNQRIQTLRTNFFQMRAQKSLKSLNRDVNDILLRDPDVYYIERYMH